MLTTLAQNGRLDGGLKVRTMTLPDLFVTHGRPEEQYADAGLQARHIVDMVLSALGRPALIREVGGRLR